MTLVQLRHFLELAHSGSFSLAADRLHLTQPALSRSIKALEDELGQLLFDRVGRRNELTAFGQHIRLRAQDLLDSALNLKLSGQQLQSGHTGRARLGLGSGPGALLMTPLMRHGAVECPNARIDIARGSTPALVQALRDRRLDALVLDIRSLTPSHDLVVDTLCELPGAFMCRKGHPLARVRQVTLERVRAYPIASTPLSDEVARILVERYGPDAHPEALVTLRCEEVASLLEVTRTTDAIVFAARALAPDLVALRLHPALDANARYGWVSLRARSQSPLCTHLRSVIPSLLAAAGVSA